jgi:hypothetical protein
MLGSSWVIAATLLIGGERARLEDRPQSVRSRSKITLAGGLSNPYEALILLLSTIGIMDVPSYERQER